jgi:NAD(P)-dependent dehydrogenase (short-subunit alcohol dehydrogenase family)
MSERSAMLDGLRVLVVGGGGVGNGRSISRGVSAAGTTVAIIDVSPDRVREACDEINQAGASAVPLVADVRSGEDLDRVIAEAADSMGGIDVLITVVEGCTLFTPWVHLDQTTDDDWDLVMEMNLRYAL